MIHVKIGVGKGVQKCVIYGRKAEKVNVENTN